MIPPKLRLGKGWLAPRYRLPDDVLVDSVERWGFNVSQQRVLIDPKLFSVLTTSLGNKSRVGPYTFAQLGATAAAHSFSDDSHKQFKRVFSREEGYTFPDAIVRETTLAAYSDSIPKLAVQTATVNRATARWRGMFEKARRFAAPDVSIGFPYAKIIAAGVSILLCWWLLCYGLGAGLFALFLPGS